MDITSYIEKINTSADYEKYLSYWLDGLKDEIYFWLVEFYKEREWWGQRKLSQRTLGKMNLTLCI